MTIASEVQQLTTDAIVELFQLDATVLGGSVYYFTPQSNDYGTLFFDGVEYVPIDIEVEGFEWNGKGAFPTPRIKITNVNLVASALVVSYGDLVGATFTRIKTFRQFLDDGSNPDPTAFFPLDIFKVDRKVTHNKTFIEWELSASIDQQGRELPGRQVLKDACTHTYRVWNGSSFVYTKASCPYTGTAYFDAADNATVNPALDICGKRLSSCRKRFGENGVLPTRAFPGVGAG